MIAKEENLQHLLKRENLFRINCRKNEEYFVLYFDAIEKDGKKYTHWGKEIPDWTYKILVEKTNTIRVYG